MRVSYPEASEMMSVRRWIAPVEPKARRAGRRMSTKAGIRGELL